MRSPQSSEYSSQRKSGVKTLAEQAVPAANPPALAAYIADMTAELARLAGEAEMPMLCYFLNLARVDVDFHAKGIPVPRDKI